MSTETREMVSETNVTVSIDNLDVSFATDGGTVTAVHGVDLDVHQGEVLAVVGESGSGKSVTARTILKLLPETATASGAVLLHSDATGAMQDVLHLSGERLRALRGTDAAMVFQEPSTVLNPVYTVGWQIAEGIRAHRHVGRSQLRKLAVEHLARVGIPDPEHRVDDYPHQFSGGQKQRIVIAMALALHPGLIIADEPTTALDVTVQAEILDLLRDIRTTSGTAILLITHNMGVVADLADRVVVMRHGSVVEQAPVTSLFSAPQHPYTRQLLASVPRIGTFPTRRAPAPSAEPIVIASDLRVTYPGRFGSDGFPAIRGVNFQIHPGEVLGMVGESGSGKTTIGRAIGGLTAATGGSLRVLGHEMVGFRERAFRHARRDIGFVFQDPASSFNPQLTIAECIAEPLIVHHLAKDVEHARGRVDELLESVQLPGEYGDRYPHELSGGQRQRASLARAIALDPKLLIADEPTSALDVSVQATVLELFRSLQERLGFACLFITHDLAVVDIVAHSVAVLYHGELVEHGHTRQVLTAPQHPYTRRLIASLPVPDPVEQRKRREAARARPE